MTNSCEKSLSFPYDEHLQHRRELSGLYRSLAKRLDDDDSHSFCYSCGTGGMTAVMAVTGAAATTSAGTLPIIMAFTNTILWLAGQSYFESYRSRTKDLADRIIEKVELVASRDDELNQVLFQKQQREHATCRSYDTSPTLQTHNAIVVLGRIPYSFNWTKMVGCCSNICKIRTARPITLSKIGVLGGENLCLSPGPCSSAKGILVKTFLTLVDTTAWKGATAAMGASSGMHAIYRGVQKKASKKELANVLRKNADVLDEETRILSQIVIEHRDPTAPTNQRCNDRIDSTKFTTKVVSFHRNISNLMKVAFVSFIVLIFLFLLSIKIGRFPFRSLEMTQLM